MPSNGHFDAGYQLNAQQTPQNVCYHSTAQEEERTTETEQRGTQREGLKGREISNGNMQGAIRVSEGKEIEKKRK